MEVQWMVTPGGSIVEVSLDQVSRLINQGYRPLGSPVQRGMPDPVYGTRAGEVGRVPAPAGAGAGAGAAAGAGAGAGAAAKPVPFPTPTPPTTEQAFGPFAAYMQQMGLGAGTYLGPAQQYQANLYEPLRGLWSLQQPFVTAQPGGEHPSWLDYLTQMVGGAGGGMSKIYSQAANVLGGFFGMTPAARQEAGLGFEPQYDPETGEALTTEETGARGLGELQELIRMALGNRYAGGASRWVASRIPAYQRTWQQQQAAGTPAISFVDYLRQRLGA